MVRNKTDLLLDAVLVTGAGTAQQPHSKSLSFHATGFTTVGAGTAVIDVEVSNDGINWIVAATISLVLAATPVIASDGFAIDAAWGFVRGNVTTITGTNAQTTLRMGSMKP